jgi:hypothetical protein
VAAAKRIALGASSLSTPKTAVPFRIFGGDGA